MSEKYPGSIIDDTLLDAINLDGEHFPEKAPQTEAIVYDPNNWTIEIAEAREHARRILDQE